MPPETGLRERKKLKARRTLEKAALELFERDGFEETTVKDIAAAVDMSPRTFFRYFDSKEDVVFKEVAADLGELIRLFKERPGDEQSWTCLRASFLDFADYLAERKDRVRARARLIAQTQTLRARSSEVMNEWSRALAMDLAARNERTEPDSRDFVLTGVAVAVFNFTTWMWANEMEPGELRANMERNFQMTEEQVGG